MKPSATAVYEAALFLRDGADGTVRFVGRTGDRRTVEALRRQLVREIQGQPSALRLLDDDEDSPGAA
jgi:hypothetical protein